MLKVPTTLSYFDYSSIFSDHPTGQWKERIDGPFNHWLGKMAPPVVVQKLAAALMPQISIAPVLLCKIYSITKLEKGITLDSTGMASSLLEVGGWVRLFNFWSSKTWRMKAIFGQLSIDTRLEQVLPIHSNQVSCSHSYMTGNLQCKAIISLQFSIYGSC